MPPASEASPPLPVDPSTPPWLLTPSSPLWPSSPQAPPGSLVPPALPWSGVGHPMPLDSTPLALPRPRPSLNFKDAETVVHVFMTQLDYCNCIVLNRLQLIQNSAARVLKFTKKISVSFTAMTLTP